MRKLLTVALLVLSTYSFGQKMYVGLMRSISIKQVSISVESGSYSIIGDTSESIAYSNGEFSVSESLVRATVGGSNKGYKLIRLVANSSNSSLAIKSLSPSSRLHYYQGDVEIAVKSGRLNVVNVVDMDDYLAGVIESEGGGGRHLEYYKVQALMSRTYALKNLSRHGKEGFQLCDGVHCQAYHNRLKSTPTIQEAVNSTRGEVIVDRNYNLVTSYFSANCGGQTCDASYVWNSSVPYLESFIDTFCVTTRQATWTKSVPKYQWKSFLEKEYGVKESVYGDQLYNFTQTQRKAFYIHPSLGIPLRDLRQKFGLKSIYFSCHLEGDQVVINGRGFGHGVGLCQEGAMNMAKAGYSYKQIAHFYFSNIMVIDYYRTQYFNQEDGM